MYIQGHDFAYLTFFVCVCLCRPCPAAGARGDAEAEGCGGQAER